MKTENKSLDILGVQPISEAINTVTQGCVQGAGAFLSRICLPAAEEFGFLLRDKVEVWRATNLEKIVQESERLVGSRIDQGVCAHPRLVHEILANGSWSDDDAIQQIWAGLLASSCTQNSNDDSNLIFVNILKQLTSVQVRIINYACENAPKFRTKTGLPYADEISVGAEALLKIAQIDNFQRLDRELDCLRMLELIGAGGIGGQGGGLEYNRPIANICPSGVALHLFVKAKGFLGNPVEFWNLEEKKPIGEEKSFAVKPKGES